MVDKHKVFISYYHKDDQNYKDHLLNLNDRFDIFEDYSVHENEIDDCNMTAENIRKEIRDSYIRDATVLILLSGKNTKMGILVINLPGTGNAVRASDEDKDLVSPGGNWIAISSREEYEKHYPEMPARLITNFMKADVKISVVNWDRVSNDIHIMKKLIDNAFGRRKTNNYDHSEPLRRNNS